MLKPWEKRMIKSFSGFCELVAGQTKEPKMSEWKRLGYWFSEKKAKKLSLSDLESALR